MYDSFTELMQYFDFEFNIYCLLVLIVFINCTKAVFSFLRIKKDKNADISINHWDILVSIISGMGLFNAIMFQGVIADISKAESDIWFNKVLGLCISAFVLFIIQFYFTGAVVKRKDN